MGFCEQCWHNWYAHDDGDDEGDWCRIEDCACDEFVPAADDSIEIPIGGAW